MCFSPLHILLTVAIMLLLAPLGPPGLATHSNLSATPHVSVATGCITDLFSPLLGKVLFFLFGLVEFIFVSFSLRHLLVVLNFSHKSEITGWRSP